MSLLDRLLGRTGLPDGFAGRLEPEERLLATATTGAGPVLVTSLGLWVPEPGGAARRIGWHLVSKATWQQGTLTVVEADEIEELDGAVLIADRPPRALRLADAGRVPETVHARVEGSIRSRQHRPLPGGAAWFVQRRVPGRDGVRLQVRAEPGTDGAALRRVVSAVTRARQAPSAGS